MAKGAARRHEATSSARDPRTSLNAENDEYDADELVVNDRVHGFHLFGRAADGESKQDGI
jgi:hypothetical protein